MKPLSEVLGESLYVAEKYREENLKGASVFRLPVGVRKGQFVQAEGVPLYLTVSYYPRVGKEPRLTFFAVNNGQVISGSSFTYNKATVKDRIKEALVKLKEKIDTVPQGRTEPYAVIYPYRTKPVEKTVEHLEGEDKETFLENVEKLRRVASNLVVHFFTTDNTVFRIDDSVRGGRQYLYVATTDLENGFFRSKLNEAENFELYEVFLRSTEPSKAGVIYNSAGSFIVAGDTPASVVSQMKEWRDFTPAYLEMVREELEKKAKKKEIVPALSPSIR